MCSFPKSFACCGRNGGKRQVFTAGCRLPPGAGDAGGLWDEPERVYTAHETYEPGRRKGHRRALLEWFRRFMRPLPWRRTYAPYEVWISEVMLQQTQMERGVGYFLRWMERFPDVSAVAAASDEDILNAWEGLGYYRRARFLHAAAKVMCDGTAAGCRPN